MGELRVILGELLGDDLGEPLGGLVGGSLEGVLCGVTGDPPDEGLGEDFASLAFLLRDNEADSSFVFACGM